MGSSPSSSLSPPASLLAGGVGGQAAGTGLARPQYMLCSTQPISTAATGQNTHRASHRGNILQTGTEQQLIAITQITFWSRLPPCPSSAVSTDAPVTSCSRSSPSLGSLIVLSRRP